MRTSPLSQASDSAALHSVTASGEGLSLVLRGTLFSEQDPVAPPAVVSDVLSVALLPRDRGSSASTRRGILCRGLIVTMNAEHRK